MAGAEKGSMRVTIVSADHPVWAGQARSVTVPAVAGSMGIMPDHEPVLTLLQKGKVFVSTLEGDRRSFQIDGGFASFDSNLLTVAVDHSLDGDKDSSRD